MPVSAVVRMAAVMVMMIIHKHLVRAVCLVMDLGQMYANVNAAKDEIDTVQ